MKKLLFLLTKKTTNRRLVNFIENDLISKNALVEIEVFADVKVEIINRKVNVFCGQSDLADYDMVYIRKVGSENITLAAIVARYLELNKVEYIDSCFKEIGPAGNKLHSQFKLAAAGFPIPDTIYVDSSKIKENIGMITGKLGYPLIAKSLHLQGNKGIFIVRKRADLDKLLRNIEGRFLLQEFINIEKEYRLLVLGSKVGVAQVKEARNYQNLKVEVDRNAPDIFIDPNRVAKGIRDIVVAAAKCLSLEIAGADVALGKDDKIYLFEVNRGPAFNQDIEKSPEVAAVSDYLGKRIRDYG